MYIVVRKEVPDNMVPVLVAHASLAAHLRFSKIEEGNKNLDMYSKWLHESHRKVIVSVSDKEFENIRSLKTDFTLDYGIHEGKESRTLDGEISCLVLIAEHGNLPNALSGARLWDTRKK